MNPWTPEEEADHATRERVSLISAILSIDDEHEQYWAFGHYRADDFLAACWQAEVEAKNEIARDEIGPLESVERILVTAQNMEWSTGWRPDPAGDVPVTRLQWR